MATQPADQTGSKATPEMANPFTADSWARQEAALDRAVVLELLRQRRRVSRHLRGIRNQAWVLRTPR